MGLPLTLPMHRAMTYSRATIYHCLDVLECILEPLVCVFDNPIVDMQKPTAPRTVNVPTGAVG